MVTSKLGDVRVHLYRCWVTLPDRRTVRWRRSFRNLIVNEGLNYLWANGYGGPLYLFPMAATPVVAATDTMASHAGWTEVTTYDETPRQTFTPGSFTAPGAKDNTASPVILTNSTGSTITLGGAGATSNSTKGGTSGTFVGGDAWLGGNAAWEDGELFWITLATSIANAP